MNLDVFIYPYLLRYFLKKSECLNENSLKIKLE